jgi:hypothetical protein
MVDEHASDKQTVKQSNVQAKAFKLYMVFDPPRRSTYIDALLIHTQLYEELQ